ncbi:ArsA family ATPase [Infirmifilum lucidum]|uniref:ArsA family ATPase n=1 Tax=Infirmifilum lucidum TaxID=2776706 RepID=A0A7L9FHR4_9CREN|nr:ArsA-related P-loop ATPase [Infirmifilum lucidum]QOJ78444.1 ArsA family ATPase [Infirmifilum lucidum]
MPVLVSFWGKGGVGKTTLSSALAAKLASEGYRVYLLSTDFIPSLQDVLGVELQGGPREVCDGLIAEQLTEEKIIQLWKERFGEEVYRVASSLFPVDREIVDYVAGAPGIVEEFTLYYVWEKFHRVDADFIVWDTMATGGGIRMLRIEKEFYEHLGEAAKLYLKLKGFFDKIRTGEAEPLELIESWRRLADNIIKFLQSDTHRALLVSRPLPVDFSVVRRVYSELSSMSIPVRAVVVNMMGYSQTEDRVLEMFIHEFEGRAPLVLVPHVSPPPSECEKLKSLIPSDQMKRVLRVIK